ncbi:VanW family protein [Anaeroselena agilis]|uniref:VanW family protein n=1 Tax=Anaeroselena agilis TaxID=3063788 RepID=A0ABU3NX81_9FIRM|nr:VanW family protein [Selenomonadales bacterium 4137-cl]
MQPTTSKPVAKNIIIFLGVIVLFSVIGTVTLNTAFTVTDDVYGGVRVGDIDVGGLTLPAAEQKIADAFNAWTKHEPITLIYNDKRWTIAAGEIDLSIDAAALAKKAYAVGRTGNIFQQLQERYLAINRGHTVPLAVGYSDDKLRARIAAIAATVDRDPRNASLKVVANFSVSKEPDAVGLKVDIDKTQADIAVKLNTKIPFVLPLTVAKLAPAITARDLEGIDGVIGSYTTQFSPEEKNRSANILIAASNLDDTIVRQGEVFSFNAIVGPRLAKNGYKIAPVFINGKLVPDWGGGVCQVSSTLYNAALLADLKIEERTPHFRPPGYVPLGLDATVADNYLDFRFRNTSGHNIYILSDVAGDQVNIHILGRLKSNPPEIHIVSADKKVWEPNTVVKQDPDLDLGKEVVEVEGQKGFHISAYRVKYAAGREIGRELISTDEYQPEDRVVRVGTKTPAPKK